MLSLGLARRGSGQLDEAQSDLEQALTLYRQQQQPLGEADTQYALAGVWLARHEPAQALTAMNRAIELVEQVMKTLTTAQQWTTFLRQYSELYAQAAITLVLLQQEEQARTLLTGYVRIAGATEIARQIKDYIASIPTGGEEMSREESERNKQLATRLKQLIQGL